MPTRVRSRWSLNTFQGGDYWLRDALGVPSQEVHCSPWVLSGYETMTDVVSEGYFEARKAGAILPVNPMTHTYPMIGFSDPNIGWKAVDRYNTTMEWRGFAPYVWGGATDSISVASAAEFGDAVPSTPSLAYMLQEARAKCHGKPVDLLTMIAELDKSVDLVQHVHTRALERARKCIDAAAKIRKGDANRVWRHMGRTARVADLLALAGSIWLEYRFGWRLLLMDLEALHELYSSVGNTFELAYERGTYEFKPEPIESVYRTCTGSALAIRCQSGTSWIRYEGTEYLRVSRKVRVGVMERFTSDRPFFGDPFVTAYELIPLSWMVDAFANVGSAIKAWSPIVSGAPVHQWMTDEVTRSKVRVYHATGTTRDTRYWIVSAPDVNAEIGTTYKSRSPVALQMPTIGLHPTGLSVSKWADIGSVVANFGRQLTRYAERKILKT